MYVKTKRKAANKSSEYKNEYYLNKYMQFVVPYTKIPIRSTGSNLPSISNEQTSKMETSSLPLQNSQESNVIIEDVDDSQDQRDIDVASVSQIRRKANRIKKYSSTRTKLTSKVDQTVVKHFQSKRHKITAEPEDPRRYFLLSLLPEVNELTEAQFKIFKRRILHLLDELSLSVLVQSSNASPESK